MQAVGVVAGADYWVGEPHELAVEGAHDLYVQAGGLVLTGVQPRVSSPGLLPDAPRAHVGDVPGEHVGV